MSKAQNEAYSTAAVIRLSSLIIINIDVAKNLK